MKWNEAVNNSSIQNGIRIEEVDRGYVAYIVDKLGSVIIQKPSGSIEFSKIEKLSDFEDWEPLDITEDF
jgi:hypothetical protein